MPSLLPRSCTDQQISKIRRRVPEDIHPHEHPTKPTDERLELCFLVVQLNLACIDHVRLVSSTMCYGQYVRYRCGHTREQDMLPCRTHQKKQAEQFWTSTASHCGRVQTEVRESPKFCSISCQQNDYRARPDLDSGRSRLTDTLHRTASSSRATTAYDDRRQRPGATRVPAPAPERTRYEAATSYRQRIAERDLAAALSQPQPPAPRKPLPPTPVHPRWRPDPAYASSASSKQRTYRPNPVFTSTRESESGRHGYEQEGYRPNPVFASASSSSSSRDKDSSRRGSTKKTSGFPKFSLQDFGSSWIKRSKSVPSRSSRRDSDASFVCRDAVSTEMRSTPSRPNKKKSRFIW